MLIPSLQVRVLGYRVSLPSPYLLCYLSTCYLVSLRLPPSPLSRVPSPIDTHTHNNAHQHFSMFAISILQTYCWHDCRHIHFCCRSDIFTCEFVYQPRKFGWCATWPWMHNRDAQYPKHKAVVDVNFHYFMCICRVLSLPINCLSTQCLCEGSCCGESFSTRYGRDRVLDVYALFQSSPDRVGFQLIIVCCAYIAHMCVFFYSQFGHQSRCIQLS